MSDEETEQKVNYTKPASQVDLEARQAEGYVPSTVLNRGVDAELSTNGYIGVDPIYQNAANDTELPIKAEDGPEAVVFEKNLAEGAEYPEQSGEGSEYDEPEPEASEPPSQSTFSSTPPSPQPPSGN